MWKPIKSHSLHFESLNIQRVFSASAAWFHRVYHIIHPLNSECVCVCRLVCVCVCVCVCVQGSVYSLSAHLAVLKCVSFIACRSIDCPPIAPPAADWTLSSTRPVSPLFSAAAERKRFNTFLWAAANFILNLSAFCFIPSFSFSAVISECCHWMCDKGAFLL